MCLCECEFDAAGAALSQIDKHNMRHYSMPSKRLVAEMRADGRDVSLHRKHTEGLTRSTDAGEGVQKERIPRDKHSFHGRDYREPQHALTVSQSIK